MFKCEKCNRITEPREKSNKVVIQKRDKHYINRIQKDGKEYTKETDGYEIVKEITVCDKCYKEVL